MTTAPRTPGTQQQFEQLFQRSRRRAYCLAYRLTGNAADAEDITQDAYVRAWHHFDSFDTSRSFDNWLFRIITNRAIDLKRRQTHLRTYSIDALVGGEEGAFFPQEFIVSDSNPEQILMRPIREERLVEALVALPDVYRQALMLYAVEERSYQEIAAAMCCAGGTIRSRIYRARRMLNRAMESDDAVFAKADVQRNGAASMCPGWG